MRQLDGLKEKTNEELLAMYDRDRQLEVKQELTGRIVPFWEGLRDEEYGGFYGYQDFDLNVQKTYEKGCILNSRILWFFSNAYLTLKDEKLRADAEHAYRFMKQVCGPRVRWRVLVCHLRRKTARYDKAYVQSGICNLCAVYVF